MEEYWEPGMKASRNDGRYVVTGNRGKNRHHRIEVWRKPLRSGSATSPSFPVCAVNQDLADAEAVAAKIAAALNGEGVAGEQPKPPLGALMFIALGIAAMFLCLGWAARAFFGGS